jgi:hypothetical protein
LSGLELTLLGGELAVARPDPDAQPPSWARAGETGFASTTVAPGETSIVCDAAAVPAGVPVSGPWRALVVAGPLDHSLTGVLAAIAAPLAAAAVPIFAVSTFDTDYVLVPADRAGDATRALRGAGHRVEGGAEG